MLIKNFGSTLKKKGFLTSISETKENVYLFVFISLLVSFTWSFTLEFSFTCISSNNNYLLESIKGRSKVERNVCQVNVLQILTNEKHFVKSINQ